jgi:hypothetical protein
MTDMIHAKGILINLQIALAPHSGYKLRLLLFQGPYEMTDMVPTEREDGSELQNNVPVYHANCSAQGHF